MTDDSVSGWRLLRTRDFGFLWSGQVVSQVGDGLNKVALLWFVYALTGSALKMTVIGLVQTICPLIFGPIIGVYLDRISKKWLMIWTDVARTIMVLLIPLLHATGTLTLERLYILVFFIALASTAFGPALSSAIPHIVTRPQLTAANALMQGGANIGVLVGPALSGLGIALIGEQNVLFVNAATYLFSALCLIPVRVREATPNPDAAEVKGTVIADMMDGFRFVFFKDRAVFFLMITLALFNVAWSGFLFLFPVIAQHVLGVGPFELGWLWSSLGVGMLMASAWLAWRSQRDVGNQLRVIAASIGVGGLAVWGLKLSGSAVLALPLIIIIGGSIASVTPVVWAILQELTPGHLLGRVFTTFSTGGMSAAMFGMAGFGWAVDRLGSEAGLLGIALILLATAVIAGHFSRLLQPAAPLVSPAPP